MLNTTHRKKLIEEIERVIPMIGKKNIQSKWKAILSQHMKCDDDKIISSNINSYHGRQPDMTGRPVFQSTYNDSYYHYQNLNIGQLNHNQVNLVPCNNIGINHQVHFQPYCPFYSISNTNTNVNVVFDKQANLQRIVAPVIVNMRGNY